LLNAKEKLIAFAKGRDLNSRLRSVFGPLTLPLT